MKIAQLYADVTVNITKELEAGAAPWLKCWKENSDGLLPAQRRDQT
jgi:antirestriction protein ArdC